MGRNRTRTTCECGFWDFAWRGRQTAEVADGDPALGRWPGGGAAPGYGYRGDFAGESLEWWASPDGKSMASYAKGPGWALKRVAYLPVRPEDRYRFARIACPACKRAYVGWYRATPARTGDIESPVVYELYDTSFWNSLSDEPCDADLEGVIEWTPELVAEALAAFHEANPNKFAGGSNG